MTRNSTPSARVIAVLPSLIASPATPAPGVDANPHRGAFRRLTLTFEDGRKNGALARRQPVAAHGWYWASQREAAKALGVSDPAIFRALRAGRFEELVLQTLGVKR